MAGTGKKKKKRGRSRDFREPKNGRKEIRRTPAKGKKSRGKVEDLTLRMEACQTKSLRLKTLVDTYGKLKMKIRTYYKSKQLVNDSYGEQKLRIYNGTAAGGCRAQTWSTSKVGGYPPANSVMHPETPQKEGRGEG